MLWMWHSLQIFLLCAVTSLMSQAGITDHWSYMTLWSIGLIAWGAIFWNLRRRGGPVTFVERQIAHSWAAGVIASIGLFIVEIILKRPVLELTPVLLLVAAGMVFLVMAGTLAGWFYIAAGLCFMIAVPMAYLGPPWSPLLFGRGFGDQVSSSPAWKYYRQRLRSLRE